jgi:dolichyl-phosphate-mannose-protein mannosyltransferase
VRGCTIRSFIQTYRLFIVSLVLGLAVRLVLAPLGWHQYDLFTYGDWAWQLLEEPRSRFYAAPLEVPGDHLPGDLTVMWVLAHLTHLVAPDLDYFSVTYKFILKLVPITADLLLAVSVLLAAQRLTTVRRSVILGSAMALNPAAIVISAVWGQWDSVSMMLVVFAIWLFLSRRMVWALPLLAYACLLKPQLGLLVPFFAIGDVRRTLAESNDVQSAFGVARAVLPGWIVGGLASVGLVLAVALPFDVGLPGMGTRWSLIDRIVDAANRYDGTSMGAYNLWYLVTPTVRWDGEPFVAGLTYHQIGLILFGSGGLVAVAGATLIRPWPVAMLGGMVVTMSSAFMLATRSHERYLFPAVVLSLVLLATTSRFWWVAAWTSAASFVNVYLAYSLYHPRVDPAFLQQTGVLRTVALANVVLFGVLVLSGIRQVMESCGVTLKRPSLTRQLMTDGDQPLAP